MMALDCEANRVTLLDEPAHVVGAVSAFLEAMDEELNRFGTIRLRAIAALRQQGLSYDRIAHTTGLSKSRIAQLATSPPTAATPGRPLPTKTR